MRLLRREKEGLSCREGHVDVCGGRTCNLRLQSSHKGPKICWYEEKAGVRSLNPPAGLASELIPTGREQQGWRGGEALSPAAPSVSFLFSRKPCSVKPQSGSTILVAVPQRRAQVSVSLSCLFVCLHQHRPAPREQAWLWDSHSLTQPLCKRRYSGEKMTMVRLSEVTRPPQS